MNDGKWPMVKLGDVLKRSDVMIDIAPDQSYQQVTVRLWGKGVALRAEVNGSEIAASRQYLVRTNQFILSRIDARNGAFGLVPDFLDGAVVSNDFPVFDLDEPRIMPAYLEWLSKTSDFVDLCKAASEGTTNRVRLKEELFLATEIPLPPLEEQRRIVGRIDALAARIAEARGLRERAVEETQMLMRNGAEAAYTFQSHWHKLRVSDLCDQPQYGYTESATFEPIGPKFLRITDIQNGQVVWDSVPYCQCDDPEKFLLRPNDIVFARTGGTTGKSFLIRECPEKTVFASYLIRLRVREQVTPEYLYGFFQTPNYWSQINEETTGTGQPNFNGKKLANLLVPLPSLSEQQRIVAYLDGLQARVEALKAMQAATAAELGALLPSVLDRAFRGEL